jgi:hypothetical protein
MKEEKKFNEIGKKIKDAEVGMLFGKPCFKVNGKAFVCFYNNCMVFKLSGDDHTTALGFDGSKLFDPSGKGRAMKEWVQVTYDYAGKWEKLAKVAFDYVSKGE